MIVREFFVNKRMLESVAVLTGAVYTFISSPQRTFILQEFHNKYCICSSQISVNSAFLTLRELIPTEPKYRKLSKIETLRLAIGYIEHLFAILVTGEPNRPCCAHPNESQRNRFKPICTFCVTSEHRFSELNEIP